MQQMKFCITIAVSSSSNNSSRIIITVALCFNTPITHYTYSMPVLFKAFWRTAGLSGEAVTWGGSSIINGIDHGPLCIVFDCTTTEGSPALVGFIGGKQQIQYSSIKVIAYENYIKSYTCRCVMSKGKIALNN